MTPCYYLATRAGRRKVICLLAGRAESTKSAAGGSEGNQTQGYRVESRPRRNGRCKAIGLNAGQKKQLSDGRPSNGD